MSGRANEDFVGIDGVGRRIFDQHTLPEEGEIAGRTNEPKAFWGNVFNLFRMAGRDQAEFLELRLFERAALSLDFAKLL